MLQKVAIHQTRLRAPGLGLDARGVCLGSRGLVLFQSWDRVVAFLSMYTREIALTHVLGSLKLQQVRSQLGAREIALSFDSISSDLLDRAADISRLAGGFTFTGTNRHFVQYRDGAAPFGYDAGELLSSDAELCLYHATFSQAYELERQSDLRQLVLSLGAHPERRERVPLGGWLLAAPALGPALARHLAHADVAAKVGSLTAALQVVGQASREHWLFQLPDIPPRVRDLLTHTPGLSLFSDVAPGVAVRFGYVHPLSLASCPVFQPSELVMFPGGSGRVLLIDRLPVLADVQAMVQLKRVGFEVEPLPFVDAKAAAPLAARLRLLPSTSSTRVVSAVRLRGKEPATLRRLAYLLGARVLARTRLAATDQGVFLIETPGAASIPLGDLYCELGERLFIPLGHELVPRLEPRLVLQALGVSSDHYVFFHADGSCHAIAESAFTSLAQALLEPHPWSEPEASEFPAALSAALPTLWLEPLGLRPLGRAKRGP